MNPQKIAVLGPGSWGTALSQVLNDNGHEVRIWGNNLEQMAEINEKHTNTRYFKDVVLDEKIKAYSRLDLALENVKETKTKERIISMNPQKIAVLGPGSWGTALSQVLNDNGHEVRIWGNNLEQMAEINEKHTNTRYFKDVVLDEKIKAYSRLDLALENVDAILFVVPTKVTRLVAKQVAQVLKHKVHILHASKGLEQGTHERISTILEEEIPAQLRGEIVVVSGPSHAEETIVRDITLISAASNDHDEAKYAQSIFSNDYFRLYTNTDVIGVETAGALKNIIAVGAGALHGLGFGDNAKAAIITRGLAEITRLGVAMGAEPLTYSGLSGVGDLIVTGTSIHSRNWRAGDALGRGEKIADIEKNMGMVIEGVSTTKAAYELAQRLEIDMPITETIYKVLYENLDAKSGILDIMRRETRAENEFININK